MKLTDEQYCELRAHIMNAQCRADAWANAQKFIHRLDPATPDTDWANRTCGECGYILTAMSRPLTAHKKCDIAPREPACPSFVHITSKRGD